MKHAGNLLPRRVRALWESPGGDAHPGYKGGRREMGVEGRGSGAGGGPGSAAVAWPPFPQAP
eukprot:272150-Chlamydomonas_euryale.AAC.3